MFERLTKTQRDILTGVLILINIGIVIFWIHFWVTLSKPTSSKISRDLTAGVSPYEAGQIGEISEKEIKEKGIVPLPPVVFNTSGVIKVINKDFLIVQGNGSNFGDKKPRELTLFFTDSTVTFELVNKTRYQGLEGLKYLKIGDKIRISSPENIRGKTEFLVSYINKLQ